MLHTNHPRRRIRGGSLSVVEAAGLLRLSRSQVHRLLQAYDLAGADGLVSKKRGRASNQRHGEDFRNLGARPGTRAYVPACSVPVTALEGWL